MRAEVLGAAWAAAVMSSLRVWAEQGAGQASLDECFDEALRSVYELPWG